MSAPTHPRERALAAAWAQIPLAHDPTAGLGSFTRRRIERMISIVLDCWAELGQAPCTT